MKRLLVAVGLALAATPASAAPKVVKTSVATGNWSAGATWSGGTVPAAGDDVAIADGTTVTLNTTPPTMNSVQVGQGASGILDFNSGNTLTVSGAVTILAGGILRRSAAGGTTAELVIGGNLSNSGTFDLIDTGTRYINLTFDTGTSATISGGGTWDVANVTFNKTTQAVTVTNTATTNFWTRNIGGSTIFTAGTYVHDTATTSTLEAGSVSISASAGVTVKQGTLNLSTSGGTNTCAGRITVEGGTFAIGTTTAAGHLAANADPAALTISGGSLIVSGSLGFLADMSWNYTQSGGTVTVLTSNSANGNIFGIKATTAANGSFTMSAGTIVLQNAREVGTADFDNRATTGSVTGGTVQFGNADTVNAEVFNCQSTTLPLPNLVVNGSTAAGTKPEVNLFTDPLTVSLNVTIDAGCVLDSNALDLTVSGNWTNNGTFTQGTRTVTFNGTAAQSINGTAATTFYNLTIANTAADDSANPVSFSTDATVSNILTITDGRLRVAGPRALTLSGAVAHTVAAAGVLDLQPTGADTATITLAGGASISMSGLLEALRASGATANSVIQATGTTGWTLTITSTGTLDARNFSFTDLSASGIVINNGATINKVRQGTLTKETALAGPCLDLSAVTGANRAKLPYSFTSVAFGGTSGDNVKAEAATPIVLFLGPATGRFGEGFDDDAGENEGGIGSLGRVRWMTGQIRNVTDAANFDTIDDALAAVATGAGDRIRPLTPFVLDENVELTKDVVLENFTIAPRTGLAADGGASLLGSLHNCAIARGGADFVNLRACTVFDPTGSAPVTTNCVGINSVFEEAAPGLTTDTNNRKGVAATIFVDAASFDFHLAADDTGSTGGTPAGWGATPLEDMEGNARAATWDRGSDEFVAGALPTRLTGAGGVVVDAGDISRFHVFSAAGRGLNTTDTFVYFTSGGGSSGAGGGADNTLYVVNLTTMTVVTQTAAVGPIVGMSFFVDNNTTGAGNAWRAWVYLIVDTDADGYGDVVQCVVDQGDGGLTHPTGLVTDPTVTNRRFGSRSMSGGTRYVYQPGADGEYRIRWVAHARAPGDGEGTDTATATANRAKFVRMFFSAYKTTATTGGALFKVNADPYDSDTTTAPDNQAFGETMWNVVPGDAAWRNFEWRGHLTFTTGGTKKIYVPVSSHTAAGEEHTVVARFNVDGLAKPASPDAAWRAREERLAADTPKHENRWSSALDGITDTTASVTFCPSDGTVIYNWKASGADVPGDINWATQLPLSPVLMPQRFYPNDFTLAAVDGAVHKVWSVEGAPTDVRNGCLASNGNKVSADAAPPVTIVNEPSAVVGAPWPVACEGKPVNKVWSRGSRIYWGTDKGWVYAFNATMRLSSPVTEGMVAGFPYLIAGARVTWIFVQSTGQVIVGTDTGGIYKFTP